MRGKKGTAEVRIPKGKRPPPAQPLEEPSPLQPAGPLRPLAAVPIGELLVAVGEATDAADLAKSLRVDVAEILRELASNPDLRQQLRQARAAADELRATRIVLASPKAASTIVRLAEDSSPRDSVMLGAAQALLEHASRIRKADLDVETPDAPAWPAPGPLPVTMLPHGARKGLAVVPKPKEG